MIVLVAARGECCSLPHIKTIHVPSDDADTAVLVAKRYLEFGCDGWETGDAVVEGIDEAVFDPADYSVPESEMVAWGLQPGGEVFWNDPDEGCCSRVMRVRSIEFLGDRAVHITEEDGSETECFISELA